MSRPVDLAISISNEQILKNKFPIHMACRSGDIKFLETAVVQATREQMLEEDLMYGWTPIHWAAYYGQVTVLNGLIKCGIDVNIQTSRHNQTPTHIAAIAGQHESAAALIQANANVNIQDAMGETPLHKAARTGNLQMVTVLLRGGADTSMVDKKNQQASTIAGDCQFKQCQQLLIDPSLLLRSVHNNLLLSNGSSGAHVANGNHPHQNGSNGTNGNHHHHHHAVKRTLSDGATDDDMMEHASQAKRMRTNPPPPPAADQHQLPLPPPSVEMEQVVSNVHLTMEPPIPVTHNTHRYSVRAEALYDLFHGV